jgi:insertion element IS1 protein InsB
VLKRRLQAKGIHIRKVYSDDYQAYKTADFAQHVTGKAHTHGVERDNARTRHWFARFRRRGLTVSKSLEMIHLSIKLYAHYHFNNNALKLISILK